MHRTSALLLSSSLLFAACPSPSTPEPPKQPLTFSFEVPRGGVFPTDFRLPYPNELWRKPDGTLDLSAFPGNLPGIFGDVIDLAEADGAFGQHAGIFLHFEGAVGIDSLPPVAETLDTDSPIFVVELRDDGSLGERIPVLLQVRDEGSEIRPDRTLALMPVFGFHLKRNARYLAAITTSIQAEDGSDAKADSDFLAIRAEGAPVDVALQAADALYEPAFAALSSAGIAREKIAWATIFEVGDPVTGQLAVADFVFSGGAGVPAPNFSTPPSLANTFAQTELLLYTAVMDTPRLQQGTPPYLSKEDGGTIAFDSNGDPIIQAIDPVNIAITIPDKAAPEGGWPVVIYNHGTGGEAASFVGGGSPRFPAAVLAAEGFAVVGIDQPLHGSRQAGSADVSVVSFNPFNVAATRANYVQAMADNVQLLRLLQAGIVLDREGTPVPLDASQLYFMGHSQGALSGPPFLAWAAQQDIVRAVVLSGSSGAIQISLTDRLIPLPNGLSQPATELLGVALGEDPQQLSEFHPAYSLIEQVVESVDPLSYAAQLITEAAFPMDVLITEGFLDTETPRRNIEAMAVGVGTPLALREDGRSENVLGLTLQGFEPLSPVFSGNRGVTAALVQFPTSDHFAVFDLADARSVYGHFLGTALRNGRAEVKVYGE
jgi:hypothetical protein